MRKALTGLALVAAMAAPISASAYVLSGTKWGDPTMGTGATITWSLMSSGVSCSQEYAGCTVQSLSSFMPANYLGEIQRAFDSWSAVANLTFVQVADDGAYFNAPTTTSGQLRIGGHYMDGAYNVLAHGFYPPPNGSSAAGDIHFDTSENWTIGYAGSGIDIYQVFTHELGHALGLKHSGDGGALMAPYYNEGFTGPQADDIAGIQYLYGAALASSGGEPAPVSEPSTLALLGAAVLGMARRRKAKA